MKRVEGFGNASAKLMVIAEAPGKEEEEANPPRPLVGPTGRLFNEFLAEAGISRDDVYCTNVIKVRPPDNKIPRLSELGVSIADFIPELYEEIKAINPNCILALGNVSLQALTGKEGILKYRGSILQAHNGRKTVPTIHPAYLLHMRGGEGVFNSNARYYIQLDINRAVQESLSPSLNLPNRLLEICRSSSQLWKFLQAYPADKFQKAAWDIETYKSIPFCIGISFVPYHAMSIPLFNTHYFKDGIEIPERELDCIWKILQEDFFSRPDLKLIAQNGKFDEYLTTCLGFDVPPPYYDTMFGMHTAYPEFPKGLAFQTSVLTREPYYKDEGKGFNPSKDSIEKILLYNCKDACVERELEEVQLNILATIEKKIGWPNWVQEFFFDFMMPLHSLYLEIESTGFLADPDVRNRLWDKYSALETTAQLELDKIAGKHINVESKGKNGKVNNFLYNQLKLPTRPSTDEDTLVALLANHAKNNDQRRGIELILDIRRYRKTKSTYLLAQPDYDGRYRTTYKVTGTETGRTSTGKVTKKDGGPLRPTDDIGLAFQTMTKHGDVGHEIREMLIADPRFSIVEVDSSQAEARIVALLSRDPDTLNLFSTTDIHKLTASWCFGVPISEITKEQRFVGKTVRHAGNYGMGKRRLMQTLTTDARKFHINILISEWKAGKILDTFHDKSPKIRGVFHKEVQEALLKYRYLVNPFGRFRMFYGKLDNETLKEALANLPQGTVGDNTKRAMINFKKRCPHIRIAIESHDAFAILCPETEVKYYGQIMKEEMERPIDFSRCTLQREPITIPAEIQAGDNYRDLEKINVN